MPFCWFWLAFSSFTCISVATQSCKIYGQLILLEIHSEAFKNTSGFPNRDDNGQFLNNLDQVSFEVFFLSFLLLNAAVLMDVLRVPLTFIRMLNTLMENLCLLICYSSEHCSELKLHLEVLRQF